MKKKNFNSKLVLKKNTISILNFKEMKNVIGASGDTWLQAETRTTVISMITTNPTQN